MSVEKELKFRNVIEEDRELLLAWANEEETRKQSFQTHRITLEEHEQWFRRAMRDPYVQILILCLGETPVGNMRFSIDGSCATLSYNIDYRYRGHGLGRELIRMAVIYAYKFLNLSVLQAETKRDNVASQKVLLESGFQLVESPPGQKKLLFFKSLS